MGLSQIFFSGTQHDNFRYRADIDGLRALAVLPVVAFHADMQIVRGGFVGVDVFFVISGYLITATLATDIVTGKFSLAAFYERRIRRILPALFAMLAFVSIFAWIYLLPSALADFGLSLISAVLSVSNIHFWLGSGYFEAAASEKPLLHTWSLGVEEQFYLAWPLLLYAVHRWNKERMVLVLALLGIVSFIVSAFGAFLFESATFYFAPLRAWELALGGLLALTKVPFPQGPIARNIMSASGAALIIGTVFLLPPNAPFPGLAALPPCLGAALIILAGSSGSSFTGQILSLRPIVFIGVISYSLYLWHWPVIVFQQNDALFFAGFSPKLEKISIILLSIFLATLSWLLVEQPFRKGRFRPSRGKLFGLTGAGAIVLCLIGAWFSLSGGFPNRFSQRQIDLASFLDYDMHDAYRQDKCFIDKGPDDTQLASECLTIDPLQKNYLLVGDSHAAHLWRGLSRASKNVNVLQATASGCLPVLEGSFTEKTRCRKIVESIYGVFLTENKVDRLLIAGQWKFSSLTRLEETLTWAAQKGIPVTLFGPVVEYDSPLPRLLARADAIGDPASVDAHLVRGQYDLDRKMAALAAARNVVYISYFDLLCRGLHCRHFDSNGHPIIFDRGHLTGGGSEVLANLMVEAGLFGE